MYSYKPGESTQITDTFNFCGIKDTKYSRRSNFKRFQGMKRKYGIPWVPYIALIRWYYSLEKIKVRYPMLSNIFLHNRKQTILWVTYHGWLPEKIDQIWTWDLQLVSHTQFFLGHINFYIYKQFLVTPLLKRNDLRESNKF